MKRDLKLILVLLLAFAFVFSTACTSGSNEPAPEPSPAPAPAPEPEPEPEPAPDYTAYNEAADRAYLDAVQTYVDLGTLPGSEESIPYSEYGDGDWTDRYAIFDLDGDGKDELVVRIAQTIMASIQENIYSYNEETGELEQLLWACPLCEYYRDGMAVKSDWSHGEGTEADNFWPYNAYLYDSNTGKYELAGYVSQYYLPAMIERGWDDQFPAEADEDGDGIVYVISDGVNSPEFVDEGEYMEWYSEIFTWAPPMEIPWQQMEDLVHPNG